MLHYNIPYIPTSKYKVAQLFIIIGAKNRYIFKIVSK